MNDAPRSASRAGPPPPVPTRVLVLGASGFVGRALVRRLLKEPRDTTLGSALELHAVARPGRIVADPSSLRPVHAHFADAHTPGAVATIIRNLAPHVVFNAMGYGVAPHERDEHLAERMNHTLVLEIAEAALDLEPGGVFRQSLIHLGSALVYGRATGNLAESTTPCPTTRYGETKLRGIEGLESLAARRGLRALTASLFTVYGPGEHPHRLLPSLARAAVTRTRVPLTSGEQRRDFTFVDDVVEALLGLARIEVPSEWRRVNVASGKLQTVRAFIEVAASVLGLSPGQLGFGDLPTRPEEMEHDDVDVTRLRTLLGDALVPSADLFQGLSRFAATERLPARPNSTAPADSC